MGNGKLGTILENQIPNSSDHDLKNLEILSRIHTHELFSPVIRLHDRDGITVTIFLSKTAGSPEIYCGQYATSKGKGRIKVILEQPEKGVRFFPGRGLLEIQHQSGHFSGNVELCFPISGINLNCVQQWLIPSFNYHGNPFGKGEYPHPQVKRPFGVRADRTAQPYILIQDAELCFALGLFGDCPTEGAVSDFPASLNWKISTDHRFLSGSIFYPYWEYGHDSQTEGIYYKKNEFKAAERGILEWEGPRLFKLPFHLWFGQSTDSHFYASVSWYVWNEAGKTQAGQKGPLYSEMMERIRFLNSAYYDQNLIPGHYRCNMAYPYAAIGFIWCSLQAAYLDWWLESWGNRLLTQNVSVRSSGRGYRALKHWAEYGARAGVIMTHYDGVKYSIGNDYDHEYINTRLLIEGVNTFLRAYTLAEALEKPEPIFQKVVRNQLDWLLKHRLADGTFARDYYRDGSPARTASTATGIVIASLCEAYRIFGDSVYYNAALRAYQSYREKIIVNEAYYGGTLDADTEDKEAGFFALDAALELFRITGRQQCLEDAKRISDYLLTYTWAYQIKTFPADSMAAENGVNTRGATSVSPENQHLDPYVDSAVALTGFFSNDLQYYEMGRAMLYFALDGRWSISQGEDRGRKQPEQLLNTNWFYNVESVTKRGDYRDIDEEWAWPQVVPCLEYLKVGGACFDLNTGRGCGFDGCDMSPKVVADSDWVLIFRETLGCDHPVLLKFFSTSRQKLKIVVGKITREFAFYQLEQGIPIYLKSKQDLGVKISVLS